MIKLSRTGIYYASNNQIRFWVAIHILGYKLWKRGCLGKVTLSNEKESDLPNYWELLEPDSVSVEDLSFVGVPNFPGNIAAAWLIVEEIRNLECTSLAHEFATWFNNVQLWTFTGEEAANTICRTALFMYSKIFGEVE